MADFCTAVLTPTALLAADLPASPEARVVPVTGWRDIGEVGIGTLASIGGEFVRIDGITPDAITVGRGCLDTVPRAHAAGTPIVFFDDVARITETSWAAGETLAVRLLPETGRGTLAFALAPEDRVTLDRRALRPLPPGNFRADGSLNGMVWTGTPVTFSWAHRDRRTQTSPVIADHLAGDIGPEPGTTCAITAVALSGTGVALGQVYSEVGLTATTRTLSAADLLALPADTFSLRWAVESRRDGLSSREAATLIVPLPPPSLVRIGSPDELDPPSTLLIGDGGRVRLME